MFTLPPLTYPLNALEPYLDAMTMEIHYAKHHQAYLNNLNAVLEKYPDLQDYPVEKLLSDLNQLPTEETDRQKIRNHGGGFANHNLYWSIMGPKKESNELLIKNIDTQFGSVEKFKNLFTQTAIGHFGSGWAWLVRDTNAKLLVYSLPNQDSPLTLGHTPLICLDIWEHAYYLKYQNRRAEYIENWWNVLRLI